MTAKKTKARKGETGATGATREAAAPAAEALARAAAAGLPGHGEVIEVALGKLKKSPRNARRTPHSEAHIEALAGSIAAKGMLQKPVVEPEYDREGAFTGCWLVTIGEGRRLAQLLRVKRKEITRAEAVSCVVDLTNDPQEISLDENVTREDLHPADQFEAFRDQAERLGRSAEEIAARFGVTPLVVRRRLKLARVSPKLIQAYRDGGLELDDLMAFAVSDDHARQEQVYEALPPYKVDPGVIRRMLTERKVTATDRRALFVGVEAYEAAGGVVLRDLFTEDRGGWLEDVALLERLCAEKLSAEAERVREAEGWKWAEAHLDYPHEQALARVYPQRVGRSEADEDRIAALHSELEALTEPWADEAEAPPEVEARIAEIEDALKAFPEPYAYRPEDVARGGVFVILGHDGEPRIERGFVRAEDAAPPQADPDEHHQEDDEDRDGADRGDGSGGEDPPSDASEDLEADAPLSAALVAELTAYRTAGLRDALAEDPDAAVAVTVHALALQVFYGAAQLTCADLRLSSMGLTRDAPRVGDCPASVRLRERAEAWAAQLPRDPVELWGFVVGLDHDSRMALLAFCVSLSLNGVRGWERRVGAWAHADALASRLRLDMTTTWTATAESYFGRVTKARIAEAVREAVSDEAAERIAPLKKGEMAEAAEALTAGKGWLPVLLRTPGPAAADRREDDDRERDGDGTGAEASSEGSAEPASAIAAE